MSITLNDNIYNYSPKSLDAKYTKLVGVVATPYASVAEANASILSAYRSIGLTVFIVDGGVNKEYWYRAGLLDGDLVVKDLTYVTADNGLTATANNIRLGGTLMQNTTITTAGFGLTLTGTQTTTRILTVSGTSNTGNALVNITNTTSPGLATALTVSCANGNSIVATGAYGSAFQGNLGAAIDARATTLGLANIPAVRANITTASTSAIEEAIHCYRDITIGAPTPPPDIGIGTGIGFWIKTVGSTSNFWRAGALQYFWTDPITATKTSTFRLLGYNLGTEQATFEVLGTGQQRLPKYGIGTFTGTVAYTLGVTATGEVVETVAGGGGGTTLYTGNGTLASDRTVQTDDKVFTIVNLGSTNPTLSLLGEGSTTNVLTVESTAGTSAAISAINQVASGVGLTIYTPIGQPMATGGTIASLFQNYADGPALMAYTVGTTNNSRYTALQVQMNNDGGPAMAIGSAVSIDFRLASNTNINRVTTRLTSEMIDVTNAAEGADMFVETISAGTLSKSLRLTHRGELVLGDDLTPSATAFFRINKTTTDYLPAFVVEETSTADNFILGQFKGKNDQLYITTTANNVGIVFNDAASNNYLILGATLSLSKSWIRTENVSHPLDFETNSGIPRARMTQAGNWTFAQKVHIGSNAVTTTPTAKLHLSAGTGSAATAPLKIEFGTLMITPEIGAIENDGDHLYWTRRFDSKRIPLDNTVNIYAVSSNFTPINESIFICTTTGASITGTIDPAVIYENGVTERVVIKKITNDVNTVTITPSTGTIDGAASYVISGYNQSITIVSNGTNLFII